MWENRNTKSAPGVHRPTMAAQPTTYRTEMVVAICAQAVPRTSCTEAVGSGEYRGRSACAFTSNRGGAGAIQAGNGEPLESSLWLGRVLAPFLQVSRPIASYAASRYSNLSACPKSSNGQHSWLLSPSGDSDVPAVGAVRLELCEAILTITSRQTMRLQISDGYN